MANGAPGHVRLSYFQESAYGERSVVKTAFASGAHWRGGKLTQDTFENSSPMFQLLFEVAVVCP